MKRINVMKRLQRGIGLLELMLSLAIIAILLIMATRYYQSASNNQNINQAVDMFNAVKSAVKNYMNSNLNSTSYPTVGQLQAAGYLPDNYATSATANPWNGTICVSKGNGPSTCGSSTGGTFGVAMQSLPGSVCYQVYQRLQATIDTAAGERAVAGQDCSAGSSATDAVVAVVYAL
jgi:type II secretory pathway pseudopilin PulG